MNPTLAAVYALLTLTLGFLLFRRAFPVWQIRAMLIVALPVLAFALWQGSRVPAGWPTTEKAPAEATFAWGVVREPDLLSGDRGAIFLWVVPPNANRPRAYQVPYSRALHQQVQAAINAVKRGTSVTAARIKSHSGSKGNAHSPFRFYRRPPIQQPTKKP